MSKILNFSDYRKYSDVFVETGTARLGGVTSAVNSGFDHIKTVEACIDYHRDNFADLTRDGWHETKSRPPHLFFAKQMGDRNVQVELFCGMSQDLLGDMLKDVKKPVVLWLDAHISGPRSAGQEDYRLRGNDSDFAQNKVLCAEIEIILKHPVCHVILIDDQHGISEENHYYKQLILKKNPGYTFHFCDEQRGNDYYRDKTLICLPPVVV